MLNHQESYLVGDNGYKSTPSQIEILGIKQKKNCKKSDFCCKNIFLLISIPVRITDQSSNFVDH